MNTLRARSFLVSLTISLAACSSGGTRTPSTTGGAGGGSTGGAGGSNATGGTGGASTGGSVGTGGSGDTGGSGGSSGGSGGGADAGGAGGSETDGSASGDGPSAPSDGGGDGGGKLVAYVYGHGEHSATPNGPPLALDTDMMALLAAKGLKVVMVKDAMSAATDATGKALLVISSSVDRALVMGKYKDVTVPAIVIKDGCFQPMGMGTDLVSGVGLNKITILPAAASDPLAAGLTGDVVVYTGTDRIISSSMLGADAKKIATLTGAATQFTVFAYEAGAMMMTGKAPAKRYGFFIHRDTDLNANGKKLFNAAVDWALQ